MKTLLTSLFILFTSLYCFGQEVEFCGSVNTSSEERFQNAAGLGLQYQQDIGKKFKAGLAVHYNSARVTFDHIVYIDAAPNLIVVDRINSASRRFSIRLNLQGMLRDNENVSFSLGPEISYNFYKGEDHVDRRWGSNSERDLFTRYNGLIKHIGLGLISKVEIKHVFDPRLSLCFTFRPEFTTDFQFTKYDPPAFSAAMGFMEFQTGFKYSFKK